MVGEEIELKECKDCGFRHKPVVPSETLEDLIVRIVRQELARWANARRDGLLQEAQFIKKELLDTQK